MRGSLRLPMNHLLLLIGFVGVYVERKDAGRDVFTFDREPDTDYLPVCEQQVRANVVAALSVVGYFVISQRQSLSGIIREIQSDGPGRLQIQPCGKLPGDRLRQCKLAVSWISCNSPPVLAQQDQLWILLVFNAVHVLIR